MNWGFSKKGVITMLRGPIIVVFVLPALFLLPLISESAPPIPARIGGTIAVDGTQLTQSTATGYTFTATMKNGTPYEPAAQDTDGLNATNYYVIDIPIYDATTQLGGASPGDTATLHVYKDGAELFVTSPSNGEFIVGQSGSTALMNLDVLTSQPLSADISLSKSVENPSPNIGESVVFTITATNKGPGDANGIQVKDQLPEGLTFISDDSGGFYNPITGLWDIGSLANGDAETLHITSQVEQPGHIINFATKMTSSTADTNEENDTGHAEINAALDKDGDVAPLGNRDGTVNVGDALVALRFALGLETPTPEDMAHGDVAPLDANGQPSPDGEINVGDALVILRKALGIVNF
jgi:uncharacterized repeat protein (TIGR01451 family)